MPKAIHAGPLVAVLMVLLSGPHANARKPTPSTTTVSVSAPSPATGAVTVAGNATAKKLARLEVYLDGNLKATCAATPCDYPWDTRASANGAHTLVAKRYDVTGAVTTSAPLTVLVNNDVTPPTVSVTAPAVATGTVTLSALATDANGVTTTQLYLDGALVASAAGGTVTYTWNTTTASNSTHTVQAKGTDPSGNVGSSGVASVSVSNTASTSPPVGGTAELPRAHVDTTYVAPTGQTIAVPVGGSFQAALDTAQPGDVITLAAGATYVGPFTLPVKTGSGWIIVRTSAPDSSLPAPGTTGVTPGDAGIMPKLVSASGPVLSASPGAHHYRFVGIEMRPTPGVYLYNVVELGMGVTTVPALPHHLIFDRCYIHGDPVQGTRRGLALNTGEAAVIDSYLSDFKEVGADSQAIAVWNGAGPFKIVNNYLEGAGENVLFGGADPSITNLVPSDIEIRENHFAKQLSWRAADASYSGTHWSIKNLLELKNAQRILIDGNLFENNWGDAQVGYAILFTPRNQNGTAPWSVVQDVTFTNNIVRHTASGLYILGSDDYYPSQLTQRVSIDNNLFDDVNGSIWGGEGKLFQIIRGPSAVVIDHSTGIHTGNIITAEGAPALGFVFTNNITFHNAYGVIGTNHGPGLDTLNYYFPGAVFRRNILIGGPSAYYPADNFFPTTEQEVGFIDPAAEDYSLAPTSPYRGAGTDGYDIGVEFSSP
jgi:Big-like domain-containing protein